MINLPVDEAFALDFLAIALVKECRLGGENNHNNVVKYIKHLTIDIKNLQLICESREFLDLYSANVEIFDTIEEIRRGREMTALELDSINNKRFAAKLAIQKKFFSTDLTETKTYAR